VVEASGGKYHHEFEWSRDIAHPVEASRGHAPSGDACSPGWFELPLAAGGRVKVEVMAGGLASSSLQSKRGEWRDELASSFSNRLNNSLENFVVQRGTGKTVIAGYPWFLDWGRDTLIVARGMLAAGMVKEVRDLVVTYAALEENGTLPNSLRGGDDTNRDTSDAPLWFGVVCGELAVAGVDLNQLRAGERSVSEVLQSIATHYRDGTPNGIRMDAPSGLIWSPTHFTWMDTNHPAGSPREGYPVEIQALWLRLLRQLGSEWDALREKAEASFQSLYKIDESWLADQLIAGPNIAAAEATQDNALRSNGLLAVALGEVTGEPAQRMVAAAQRHLVVPGAVRSLAPLPVEPPLPVRTSEGALLNNPDEPYWGRYEGDEDTRRKPAYHNGTAWVWSLPVFCEALVRAWDFSPESITAARSYLLSMEPLLNEGCLGHLPEVLDGDAPHTQRGCDAQAWSAGEAYRVWRLLET
jgi:predicted glycogen debranching enzyme